MEKRKQHLPFAWVQICWICAGVALLAAGLHVINVPDEQLVSVADHLGVAMLFSGCINLIVYIKNREKIHGSHWLLADGMSTALLSIFPLFNRMILPVVIPFFFGIWELFSGILKFIDATELSHGKIRGWQWFLMIGLVELVSGVASMIKPIDDFVGMNHVIAIILFVQSTGFLFKILVYNRLIIDESQSNSVDNTE